LIEREEEQLLRRCDEFINSIVRQDRSTYTLGMGKQNGFFLNFDETGRSSNPLTGFLELDRRFSSLNWSTLIEVEEEPQKACTGARDSPALGTVK